MKGKIWSDLEGQLLLRILASKGPSFVLNKANSTDICQKIFPNRCDRQILMNGHTSSITNPLLACGLWSDNEKMTLCLAMKSYQNCTQPFQLVTSHIRRRAYRHIVGKWRNSLNPMLERTPFSKEEDELLINLSKEIDCVGNWVEIAERFPTRAPNDLRTRLNQLSSVDGFIRRGEDTFKYVAANMRISGGFLSDFVVRERKASSNDVKDHSISKL